MPGADREEAVMPKILLAEDDNDMRRFLVKALENAGYAVTDFDNGLSAYKRLREEPYELLLTDIVMPEMDGIELARRAAELDPDIKIMFITGFAAVAVVVGGARDRVGGVGGGGGVLWVWGDVCGQERGYVDGDALG
jgi:two-component system, cell cycle response regulator CpdR